MRYHLFLPQMRMTHDQIVERALAAEAAGFEGVAFMDHLAPPLAVEAPMWEAMQVAGWVLARTSTLRVGTGIFLLPVHNPVRVAEQVAQRDRAHQQLVLDPLVRQLQQEVRAGQRGQALRQEVVRLADLAQALVHVVGGEDLLGLLPSLGGDERFVLAGVEDASVADDAHVVGVAEQPLDVGDGERLGRLLRHAGGPRGHCPKTGRLRA